MFGDHSEFDALCYEAVTELRRKYPYIRRVHYRAAYQEIGNGVRRFFSVGFEDSICPDGVASAGRAAYAERNRAMIRDSDICVFYYDEDYCPNCTEQPKKTASNLSKKSGTHLAFEYAEKEKKIIINLNEKAGCKN